MDEKLLTQIRLLKKYIDMLGRIGQTPKEQFLEDDITSSAAERYLQLAIETCINMGNRIIALEQVRNEIQQPETYAEIFEKLFQLRLIDEKQLQSYKKMARFRNKLVHIYWEIEREIVYEIIGSHLKDLNEFLQMASDYIANNQPLHP